MSSGNFTRREFIATSAGAGLAATGLFAAGATAADNDRPAGSTSAQAKGKQVALVCDPADTIAASIPAQWAIGQLTDALKNKGVAVRRCKRIEDALPYEFSIVVASPKSEWLKKMLEKSGIALAGDRETVALASAGVEDRPAIFACGSDARGVVYAVLEVADRVTHSDPPLAALEAQKPIVDRPANSIRSIGRLFTSDIEDLPWYRNRSFWQNYLTMLATERFNRFNLTLGLGYDFARQIRDSYFYFPYPFFLAVPGYDVRATMLSDADRDENRAMLKFMSDEAAQRGLDFQLGLWCHAYQWANSGDANHTIEGLNPDNHMKYCRDALKILLRQCPNITGVTIRTHGESGVTEGSYEFWQAIFDGAADCGRKVEIDLHAKGIDQKMIDGALSTGMPVVISPKYWAEHTGLPYQQSSIRALELPSADQQAGQGLFSLSNGVRKFMRYSYGDLLREDRKYGVIFRMWPGSMKLLLWGDPEMAASWGRFASFCGSQGMEIFEPLSFKGKQGSGVAGGRNGYRDAALKPTTDWEKYRYTYRLWGRLLYNPDCEPETWRRMLRTQWQAAAPAAEQALAAASRILPLITSAHLPSAANANYLPEIYTNMSISDPRAPNPYGDSPSPRRFGTVSPLDPEMFATMDQCATELLSETASGKCTPLDVANWLGELSDEALAKLAEAHKQTAFDQNVDLRRVGIDVQIEAQLGKFFAHKFRAGVLFAIFDQSGEKAALEEAIKQYRLARDAWAEAANVGKTAYVADITFGLERQLRGSWTDRQTAIDQDVQRLAEGLRLAQLLQSTIDATKTKTDEKSTAQVAMRAEQIQAAIHRATDSRNRVKISFEHTQPEHYEPGQSVSLAIAVKPNRQEKSQAQKIESGKLRYRHVNQAEPYQTADLNRQDSRWVANIPAKYTSSPFPIQYFFELRETTIGWSQFPGLDSTLCNQPYYVIRQVTQSSS